VTRALTSPFAAALAGAHVTAFPLIELGFASGTDYVCGLAHDVTWSGNTYSAAQGLISIEALEELADEQLQELAAEVPTLDEQRRHQQNLVNSESARAAAVKARLEALRALQEKVQGRPVTVRLAVLDAAGALQVDTNVWQGLMDTMQIDDNASNCVVSITAEHMLAVWDRPRPARYTDAAQQALYPGDRGLEYVAAVAEAQIVWPGKEFFAA